MINAIPTEEMIIAEDALIADVQFAIHNLLERKGVSRAELARRMRVSEPYVSQVFKDNTRNLTLKTIARIFRAVDEEPRISSELLDQMIPVSKKRLEALPSRQQKREDWIALILSEKPLIEIEFCSECNDNEHEVELVAA